MKKIEKIIKFLDAHLQEEVRYEIEPGAHRRWANLQAYKEACRAVKGDPMRIALNGVIYRIIGTSKREVLRALRLLQKLWKEEGVEGEVPPSLWKYVHKGGPWDGATITGIWLSPFHVEKRVAGGIPEHLKAADIVIVKSAWAGTGPTFYTDLQPQEILEKFKKMFKYTVEHQEGLDAPTGLRIKERDVYHFEAPVLTTLYDYGNGDVRPDALLCFRKKPEEWKKGGGRHEQ